MNREIINQENLRVGEIYHRSYNNHSYISKFKSVVGYQDANIKCIDIGSQVILTSNYATPASTWIFRKATEEEKMWLEACNLRGVFVPLSDIQPIINNSYSIY